MKIEMEAGDLLALLKAVHKAVAQRTTKPVLAMVKLRAADDALTATATDLEVGLRASAACKVLRAGEACVAPGKLMSVLAEVGGLVELCHDGDVVRLKVVGRKDKWQFPARPPDEFPDLPGGGGEAVAVLGADLRRAVRQAEYAASTKDNNPRFNCNGVLFEAGDGGLVLVGTDTKRLAVGECPADVPAGFKPALVPLKAVRLLVDLCPDGPAVLRFTGNDVLAECGGAVVYSRLLEGRFPQWRQFVPKRAAFAGPLGLDFIQAVRAAAITSDDENKRVDVAFAGGSAVLTAAGAETGASEVVVDVPGCDFELKVAFDPAYLQGVWKAAAEAGAEGVAAEFGGSDKPAVFRWAGGMGLVMPMGERE